MISYHEESRYDGSLYKFNWKTFNGQCPIEIEPFLLKGGWSGIVWEPGIRLKENFKFSDWCVLDFENPKMPLAQALETFKGYTHAIGTTRKHQKPDSEGAVMDRFRVAIPWRERIDSLELYEFNMKRLQKRYGADPAPTSGGSFFFRCTEIVSIQPEGQYMIAENLPPKKPKMELPKPKYLGGEIHLPRWIAHELMFPVPNLRHKRGFFLARCLGELGFSLSRTVELLMSSSLKEAEDDFERTVKDGWQKGAAKCRT